MSENIEIIATSEDWKKITDRRDKVKRRGKITERRDLKVVVDPMVFRTADVFLRGKEGWEQYQGSRWEQYQGPNPPKNAEQVWQAIKSNIGSLCTFFDLLIQEESLPMFDYYSTFPPDIDMGSGGTHWLVNTCNGIQKYQKGVIVEVSVQDNAYRPIREAAIGRLPHLPRIHPQVEKDILAQLSAFEYEWRPDLWPDEEPQPADERRVLEAFRYGGLLFSEYARQTNSDHVLQPKRSTLYLRASLGAKRALTEKTLFRKLTEIANEAPKGVLRFGDLPETPTFLPYLLKLDPETPYELLEHAVNLRKTADVANYRAWREEILEDIDKGRAFSAERQEQIEEIAAAIRRKCGVKNSDGSTETKVKISGKIGFLGPLPRGEIEIGLEGNKSYWANLYKNWVLMHRPGHGYRKLLMKMVISQKDHTEIDQHLERIWKAA